MSGIPGPRYCHISSQGGEFWSKTKRFAFRRGLSADQCACLLGILLKDINYSAGNDRSVHQR